MAQSRPESMIIPPEVFDEINTTNVSKKRPAPVKLRSSSSSADSTNVKNINSDDTNSSSQNLIQTTTTTSSTTTDSDFESEQDDNLNSQMRKSDSNSQEQLSGPMKHFHKLFKNEITGEMPTLIDSYVCAYQGDILLQGKMYITDRYLCFHSRIISYVTKHVYRWEQIEDVTKERVAFIFPTAVGIQLKDTDKKIIYASFLQRDQAHDKIVSVWSRHNHDVSSYDDEESEIAQDGTLKATTNNGNVKYPKRDSYDIIDGPDRDDVLDLCIKETNKRPTNLLSTKQNHNKQQSKVLINSYNKKTSEKTLTFNDNLSNDSNGHSPIPKENGRNSRFSKNEKKQHEASKRNSSLVNHRSKIPSSKSRQSHSQDRTLSSINESIPHTNSSAILIPNRNPSTTDTKPGGIPTKLFQIILSLLNAFIQYARSIIHHIQTYPVRTTILMLLFLTVLFFHAFYLIQLAKRIETRLQSLHNLRPIRDIVSKNTKEL